LFNQPWSVYLAIIDGKMDQEHYLEILKQNLRLCANKFGLGANFKFYQNNYQKHKA